MLASVRAGIEPRSTLEGFAQGPAGEGTQGWGVNTPIAAEVAEETAGLAILLQSPKLGILVIGATAIILPTGVGPIIGGAGGNARGAGVAPIEQVAVAPATTNLGI